MDTVACILWAAIAIDRQTFWSKVQTISIAVAFPTYFVQDNGHIYEQPFDSIVRAKTNILCSLIAENILFPHNIYRFTAFPAYYCR